MVDDATDLSALLNNLTTEADREEEEEERRRYILITVSPTPNTAAFRSDKKRWNRKNGGIRRRESHITQEKHI